MAKVAEKGAARSAKAGQLLSTHQSKAQSGANLIRTVKPAPTSGSFSRADARSAVMSVMHQGDVVWLKKSEGQKPVDTG